MATVAEDNISRSAKGRTFTLIIYTVDQGEPEGRKNRSMNILFSMRYETSHQSPVQHCVLVQICCLDVELTCPHVLVF